MSITVGTGFPELYFFLRFNHHKDTALCRQANVSRLRGFKQSFDALKMGLLYVHTYTTAHWHTGISNWKSSIFNIFNKILFISPFVNYRLEIMNI